MKEDKGLFDQSLIEETEKKRSPFLDWLKPHFLNFMSWLKTLTRYVLMRFLYYLFRVGSVIFCVFSFYKLFFVHQFLDILIGLSFHMGIVLTSKDWIVLVWFFAFFLSRGVVSIEYQVGRKKIFGYGYLEPDEEPEEETNQELWRRYPGRVLIRTLSGIIMFFLLYFWCVCVYELFFVRELLQKIYKLVFGHGITLARISQMKFPFEYNKASFGHINKGFSSFLGSREGEIQWVKAEKMLFGWFLIPVSNWNSMAQRSLPTAG